MCNRGDVYAGLMLSMHFTSKEKQRIVLMVDSLENWKCLIIKHLILLVDSREIKNENNSAIIWTEGIISVILQKFRCE